MSLDGEDVVHMVHRLGEAPMQAQRITAEGVRGTKPRPDLAPLGRGADLRGASAALRFAVLLTVFRPHVQQARAPWMQARLLWGGGHLLRGTG